jgi:DHA3 family macrolide efflux protein-like MFS transporter
VPEDKLMKVNGLHNSINSFTMLIAPVVSGALLATTNLEVTFFIDVATAMIAIGILLSIKIKPHAKALEEKTTGYFFDLKEGLRYVKGHRLIRSILSFYAIFFFLVVPVALLNPLMVVRSFGSEVWKLTVNEVVYFAGAMLGGVLISIYGGFKNRKITIITSCVLFGVLCIGMGLAPTFVIYLIISFVSGLVVPFFDTAITVTLQEKVETNMQGRVFSFIQIIITAVMPFGMVVFGPLADVVSVQTLLIITGVLMAFLAVIIRSTQAIKSL